MLMRDPSYLADSSERRTSSSRLPERILQFKPWDCRRIMAEARFRLLSGNAFLKQAISMIVSKMW